MTAKNTGENICRTSQEKTNALPLAVTESQMKAIGWNLQEIRKRRYKSRELFSEKSGISVHTIKNIETGKSRPSYDMIILFCSYLHISPVVFFPDEFVSANDREIVGEELDRVTDEAVAITDERKRKVLAELIRKDLEIVQTLL